MAKKRQFVLHGKMAFRTPELLVCGQISEVCHDNIEGQNIITRMTVIVDVDPEIKRLRREIAGIQAQLDRLESE